MRLLISATSRACRRSWGVAMSVLVTGGTGYIGSHVAIELINAGEQVIVLDNLYGRCPADAFRGEFGRAPQHDDLDAMICRALAWKRKLTRKHAA